MDLNSLDVVNQAVTNLLIGIGLALLNLIVCYFVPAVPRVISVLRWGRRPRVFVAAYLIALALQLVTSPFFRSFLHSVYTELAWSPYQALFDVLGVLIVDLAVGAWAGMRRGAEVGRKQLDIVKERAADGLDDLGLPIGTTPEEHAARLKAQEEAEAQALAERKRRMDDRLKDY